MYFGELLRTRGRRPGSSDRGFVCSGAEGRSTGVSGDPGTAPDRPAGVVRPPRARCVHPVVGRSGCHIRGPGRVTPSRSTTLRRQATRASRRTTVTRPPGAGESTSMSTHTSTNTTAGFSAAERAAMKQRAEELRAEGRSGAKKAEGLQALLDSIAKMAPADRAIAERVHVTVSTTAPDLAPRTWYGMPAYTNAEGKVVLSFKNAGKFGQRYSTLEFQDSAHLDDGDLWPVGFALLRWSPEVEDRIAALVRAAVS